MANDIVRHGHAKLVDRNKVVVSIQQTHPKKHAKKAAKHVAKKHAKKAAKHLGEKTVAMEQTSAQRDGMISAFHHMQRASVVISLMEKGTGEDLRDLLERGVKLYESALKDDVGGRKVLRAIGVLRAAEHLSLAGLYAARHKHRQKIASPDPKWVKDLVAETDRRLEKIERKERGKGQDLYPVSVELLRQAEDADHDAHLAYELAMSADALCFALENGL